MYKRKRGVFMKLLVIISILLTGFLFSGCKTLKTNNSSGFSGKFSCPGYKGEDNEWKGYEEIVERKVVNGVDIIVTDIKTDVLKGSVFDKAGPYTKNVSIIDGMWRYFPFYRNKTLYPVKVKYEKLSDNKLTWEAEYPDYIDNKGIKRPARNGKGTFRIDQNGDQVFTGSHYTGQIKCKRIK